MNWQRLRRNLSSCLLRAAIQNTKEIAMKIQKLNPVSLYAKTKIDCENFF